MSQIVIHHPVGKAGTTFVAQGRHYDPVRHVVGVLVNPNGTGFFLGTHVPRHKDGYWALRFHGIPEGEWRLIVFDPGRFLDSVSFVHLAIKRDHPYGYLNISYPTGYLYTNDFICYGNAAGDNITHAKMTDDSNRVTDGTVTKHPGDEGAGGYWEIDFSIEGDCDNPFTLDVRDDNDGEQEKTITLAPCDYSIAAGEPVAVEVDNAPADE